MNLTTATAKEMGKKSSRLGVPNKTTSEIREAFQMIVENNLEQFQEDLESLEPIERLKFILDLSRFVLPTLKAIDVHSRGQQEFKPIIISFED